MTKILILSELRDEIIPELSGDFEIISESGDTTPDLVIADAGMLVESVPRTKVMAVFHDGEVACVDCDDFIVYPFHKSELCARVERLVNRHSVFTNGALTIDYVRSAVMLDGKAVHLTLFEYRLLCLLAKNCGSLVGYSTIMNELWGSPIGSEMLSVRVFVNALRKKLGEYGELIKTHMGKGYSMENLTV